VTLAKMGRSNAAPLQQWANLNFDSLGHDPKNSNWPLIQSIARYWLETWTGFNFSIVLIVGSGRATGKSVALWRQTGAPRASFLSLGTSRRLRQQLMRVQLFA